MVRLIRGFFGCTESYAIQDFELILVGPVTAAQIPLLPGVGLAWLQTPTIGARQSG